MNKIRVLMIGPARTVKGGMTTVVNNYFNYGLSNKVKLEYIETINDGNKISKFFKEIIGIIKYKKQINNYDIVHIHMASRRSTFRKCKYIKIAKKKDKRIIVHIHGGGFRDFYENECNQNKKNKIRKYLNSADKIIVLSKEWKEFFRKIVNIEKITIIENGTPIQNDFNKDIDNKKILYLGRINREKGIYVLLDAATILIEKFPNINIRIGGDGEIKKIEEYIIKRNLSNNVTLLGWLDETNKEKELKESTYFILPSYYEGMPMSLIEAMAHKCISIATNVGGVPEVIKNKENGFIITPGNKQHIVKTFELCFENRKIRHKISENARVTISKKFNIENNINKTFNIYKNMMNVNKPFIDE